MGTLDGHEAGNGGDSQGEPTGTAPVLDPTFRGGGGNVGIIRSPNRATALPDPPQARKQRVTVHAVARCQAQRSLIHIEPPTSKSNRVVRVSIGDFIQPLSSQSIRKPVANLLVSWMPGRGARPSTRRLW